MKNLGVALWAEYMKVRRSGILLATMLIFTIIPLMLGLIMYIAAHPDIAEKLGIIGTKAGLFGASDWFGYIGLLKQTIATIGLIGFGFVTTWVFGREYLDRTLKDILALPVSRNMIVPAKLLIAAAWSLLLSVLLYVAALLLGKVISIPNWSPTLWQGFTRDYFITVGLTFLLSTPVSWITTVSRGIIAPFGFIILTMIMAQFTGLIGWGPYFPWAIPGLFSVHVAMPGMKVVPASYIILAGTFLFAYFATLYVWQHGDHH